MYHALMRSAVFAFLILALGCDRAEEVRRYKVPKDPSWRMLGAWVSAKESTWFFKVTGADENVGANKGEVVRFLKALKLEEGEVRFDVPQGWVGEKGSGERMGSLLFGTLEPRLKMTVNRLAGEAGGPLANVNRWRGQLGLAPVAAGDFAGLIEKIPFAGGEASLVDLKGPKEPSGPPQGMAAQDGGGGPRAGRPEPSIEDVQWMFSYSLPPGWAENRTPKQDGMMKRIFEFTAGGQALVTLSGMGGDAGGLVPNINRWRGQAGLEPLPDDQAAAAAKTIPFLGGPGQSVEFSGKERAILVAFKLHPEVSFFLKMDGPPAIVGAERGAFEQLAASFRMGRRDE